MALLGNVSDMINRIRDNEALRKARHDRNHKIRDSYSEKINRENSEQDHETALKEFKSYKEDLKLKLKKENRKSAFNLSIRILILLVIIVFLYFIFYKN
jgi:hypothetical protein